MNKTLAFAALAESATGVALIAVPSLVAQLLLGAELRHSHCALVGAAA